MPEDERAKAQQARVQRQRDAECIFLLIFLMCVITPPLVASFERNVLACKIADYIMCPRWDRKLFATRADCSRNYMLAGFGYNATPDEWLWNKTFGTCHNPAERRSWLCEFALTLPPSMPRLAYVALNRTCVCTC